MLPLEDSVQNKKKVTPREDITQQKERMDNGKDVEGSEKQKEQGKSVGSGDSLIANVIGTLSKNPGIKGWKRMFLPT